MITKDPGEFSQTILRDHEKRRPRAKRERSAGADQDAPIEAVTLLVEDLRDLATVYADHGDDDQAWRPSRAIDLRPGMGAHLHDRRGSS